MSIKMKLKEIANVEMGQSPDSNYVFEYDDLGMPFLQGNADFGDISPSPQFYCSKPLKQAQKGDILISVRAPVGAVNLADQSYCIGRGLAAIRPKNSNVSSKLFQNIIFANKQSLIRVAQGSTFEAISKNDLLEMEIYVPESDLLQKIDNTLDVIEQTISQTRIIIEKLNNKKQGLLLDLLTRGVNSQGNLRPSYEDAPDLYEETELGFIPKEWEICGLHDIQRADKPVLKTGPFGSALKSEHWRESGHPVITIGSLGVNSIIESELLYIDDLTFNGLSTYLVEGGDIIFSRVADVGRCLIVQEHHKDWVMSSNLMRISVDNKIFKPELLTFILSSSSSLRKQIRKLVNSAGRDVANGEVLMKLKFAKPPVEEQVKIINIVEHMNMAIDQELEQLNKLSNIKTGLLKDLLQN